MAIGVVEHAIKSILRSRIERKGIYIANWSNPSQDTGYLQALTDLKARDIDAVTLCLSEPSNMPVGSMKWNRSLNIFQEFSGSAWTDKVLALSGGGTGSTSASGSRTALGLGSMALQNSNAVTISGGNITSLSQFVVTCDILPTNSATRAIGSNAQQFLKGYFSNGFKLPVGTNLYLTG